MIYATSDLHGYNLEAFLLFLEHVNFSRKDQLYIIGDVNDRNGDGGIAMYRWIMQNNNVKLIRGNHEQMLLDCEFLFTDKDELIHMNGITWEQEKNLLRWNRNGSSATIENLVQLKVSDPEEHRKLFEFIKATPLYQELAIGNNHFVLVHGGFPDFKPEKPIDQYKPFDLIWTRPEIYTEYWNDKMVVLGHTPTRHYGEKGRMFVTKTWIDIDTDAASGGNPMLLRLDDLKPFYIEEMK